MRNLRGAERTNVAAARGQRAELQGGEHVVALEVREVREHVFDRHA